MTTMNDLNADLVRELIKERRRERRWKNIRFFVVFMLIGFSLFSFFSLLNRTPSEGDKSGYVSLVRLEGMIAPGQDFSAENALPLLERAFKDQGAKGVVIDINSGGGTPVQASIIHDAIIKYKKKYNKKVIVVGEDLMASGAYFVAVAADKIYVNPNSITGSIGVILKEFGFPDLIKKIGVERRVFAAGQNKNRLDPFLPENQADIEKIQQVINEVHGNFEAVVLEGRKGKLHADPSVLFSGDFWSGKTALKLGLVDGLGNLSDVLQTEFKVNSVRDYSQNPSLIKSILGQFSTSLSLENNHIELWSKL